ncbi:MAG: hypothetical protein ACI4MH_05870 [Candidatus Coproplasma sp.]
MKVLNWFFNVKSRHRADVKRYENGKIGVRIFVLIEMLILVGATVAVELWCLNLYENNFLAGLACTILLIAVAWAAIETCGVYCVVGFKMAAVGAVFTAANRIDERNSDSPDSKDRIKTYKAFDVFIGILSLLLALGTVAAIIVILYLHMG